MSRIRRIGVTRSAFTISFLMFLLALVMFVLVAFFFLLNDGKLSTAATLVIIMPLTVGSLSYATIALCFFFYNVVARWTGGIDIDLENN